LIGSKSASDDHHRQEPDHDYRTAEALRAELPTQLAAGPRVIKRNRGNGGQGVWSKITASSS
jgi:hypothetical protein